MTEEIKEPEKKQEIIRNEKGQFVEGQSGNPTGEGAGRPKGTYSMVTILKRKLAEVIKEKGIEKGEELVDVWIKKGGEEFEALKEIVRYTDGMPKQQIEHSGQIMGLSEEEKVKLNKLLLNENKKMEDEIKTSETPEEVKPEVPVEPAPEVPAQPEEPKPAE